MIMGSFVPAIYYGFYCDFYAIFIQFIHHRFNKHDAKRNLRYVFRFYANMQTTTSQRVFFVKKVETLKFAIKFRTLTNFMTYVMLVY